MVLALSGNHNAEIMRDYGMARRHGQRNTIGRFRFTETPGLVMHYCVCDEFVEFTHSPSRHVTTNVFDRDSIKLDSEGAMIDKEEP